MFDELIIKNIEFANQVRTFDDTLVHFGRRTTNGFVFYFEGKNRIGLREVLIKAWLRA